MTTVLRFPEPASATPVESASMLKQALRKAFPRVRFSVRLSRGTGYGYCHVRWTDGPSTRVVEQVTERFRGSQFDGMTDSEEYIRQALPDGRLTSLRGVLCQRDISPAFWAKVAGLVAAKHGIAPVPPRGSSVRVPERGEWFDTLVHHAITDRREV